MRRELCVSVVVICGLAASAHAQLGTGWTPTTFTKVIHLDNEAGLQTFPWEPYKSVCSPICADYRYDSASDSEFFRLIDNRTNRSEIRLRNEYSTGRKQFEGYVTFSSPLDDESLMQVFGSTSGATQMMIRGYAADGGTLRTVGGGGTLLTGVYGKENRINVIHVQGSWIRVYVNGSQKAQISDGESVNNYWKYGCYGTLRTPAVTVKWRRVRTFTDGQPPSGDTTPSPTPTPTPTPTMGPTPTPTPTACACPGVVEVTPPASGVTASANDGNLPGNTVDNNLGTRWSANGDGQWIRYDLGTTHTLAYVRIAVYNGNTRQNRFDLQVSGDDVNWTNVRTGVLTSGTTTSEETHDFADVPARYVRYVGHGATTSTFNSVTEVSLFASTAPVVTPTPTATPTPLPPTPTPTPLDVPVDITPGGAAVSASTHDGNLPANSVDNNLATRWSANGDGQWIQYDLGATRTTSSVKIAWYSGNMRRSTFDVLTSDGAAGPWSTLLAGQMSSGTTTALETYDVADGSGRYVRILGHGNSVNGWNSISEVEIWGR